MKAYGKNVIYEAIRSNYPIYHAYLREDIYNSDSFVIDYFKKNNIKVTVYDKQKMNLEFKGLNQGYGAEIKDIYNYSIEEIVKPEKKQLVVILDKLEDPNNLGAIIRSCDAFSVDAIIIPNKNGCQITDTVIKVSTGAIFHTPICVVSNLNQAILKLKKLNFWIVGTDASANTNIFEFKNDRNIGLVIGSEGYGMSYQIEKNCDYLVKIPMTGHVNSLNASVSAGIMIAALKNQSIE